mgnify:CR=1 FL=1
MKGILREFNFVEFSLRMTGFRSEAMTAFEAMTGFQSIDNFETAPTKGAWL